MTTKKRAAKKPQKKDAALQAAREQMRRDLYVAMLGRTSLDRQLEISELEEFAGRALAAANQFTYEYF